MLVKEWSKKIENELIENEGDCKLCLGSFLKLDEIANSMIKELDSANSVKTLVLELSSQKVQKCLRSSYGIL
ncbi:MAG: hypothetical protein N2511_08385 [Thermodesulfovibrionales bacterium]|nr:hypothetical protein [Thermodesulfovibrionales bacterium]